MGAYFSAWSREAGGSRSLLGCVESTSIFKNLVNVSDLTLPSSHLAGEFAECVRNWDTKLLCEVRRERALHFKHFGFSFKREDEACDQDQRWNH